jgi:hypothetical protein
MEVSDFRALLQIPLFAVFLMLASERREDQFRAEKPGNFCGFRRFQF